MILGFKKQFKPLILEGSKIHTIRQDSKDRWEAGKKIHFATGTRSANYNCFLEGEAKAVQYVFMTYDNNQLEVSIGDDENCDKYLYWPDIDQLAKNDGFDGYDEFAAWFIPLIKSSEINNFSGKIIHWTDFKYDT